MILLTFLVALSIAGVAAWFSIAGIMSIFAGAKTAALIMGGVLEAGKLLTASWLYRNWKESPILLKMPLVFFTVVLMFITSMGIFGFLSKAHIEQGASTGNNSAKVERIDEKISQEQLRIKEFEKQISQLDEAVDRFVGQDKVTLSVSLRKRQQAQRDELVKSIDASRNKVDTYNDEKYALQSEIRGYELEVGPIKYIAALIYDDPKTNIEAAVRIVTLIIVSVFDPFAVILLIAANYSLLQRKDISIGIEDEKKEAPFRDDSLEILSGLCVSSPTESSESDAEIKQVSDEVMATGLSSNEALHTEVLVEEVKEAAAGAIDEEETPKDRNARFLRGEIFAHTEIPGHTDNSIQIQPSPQDNNRSARAMDTMQGIPAVCEEILVQEVEAKEDIQVDEEDCHARPEEGCEESERSNLVQSKVLYDAKDQAPPSQEVHPLEQALEAEIEKRIKFLHGFSPKAVEQKSIPKVSGWLGTPTQRR